MKPKTRILLDCDGVISDFLSSALKVLNTKLKLKGKDRFNATHITQWDICKSIGQPHMWKDINDAAGKKGFCQKIRVYPGSKEGVAKLKELGEVFVVTSPLTVPNWVSERSAWLEEHFEIGKSNVVHTEAKHVIVGDVLIDDKFSNIESWVNHHPNGLGLLWNAPYNQDASWSFHCDQIARISSWEDAVKLIQEHAEKKNWDDDI
jgi:5'(3')-deoxyribonucleotidase